MIKAVALSALLVSAMTITAFAAREKIWKRADMLILIAAILMGCAMSVQVQ